MEDRERDPDRIGIIDGDGAGPELARAVRLVLGRLLPDATLVPLTVGEDGAAADVDAARSVDLIVKGPLASPQGGGGVSRNVRLRRDLGCQVQVRHARSPDDGTGGAGHRDLYVVRDVTEGLFAGHGADGGTQEAGAIRAALSRSGIDLPDGAAISIDFATPAAAERVWRAAIDLADATGHRRVVAVHKAAAVPHTDSVLLDAGRRVMADHQSRSAPLQWEATPVDTVCARLAAGELAVAVLVTTAMYGDICSDVAAAVCGGVRGMAGANVGPGPVVAEAAHGAVWRHAGAGTVDPTGLLRSVGLALTLGGWGRAARRLDEALGRVRDQGLDDHEGRTQWVAETVAGSL